MKKISILLPVILLISALTAIAQDATNKHHSDKERIPFGKKFLPPDLIEYHGRHLQQTDGKNVNKPLTTGKLHGDMNARKKQLDYYKQQLKNNKNTDAEDKAVTVKNNNGKRNNSDYNLTTDINALAESNPTNISSWYSYPSYAKLKGVIYFAANDGIHGNELWRTDGTDAGTFMVKDVEPGETSSDPFEITEANGKIYFSANTSAYGNEPWVSDGTESGTQMLIDINPVYNSDASFFVKMGKKVYFAANNNDYLDALWETDGSTTGTKLVKSLGLDPGGFLVSQLTAANGLLYFTFISYTTFAYELWRSDGTAEGTYHIGTNDLFYYNLPLQLTSYNNRLYFSADNDGSGSKLWVTDGTDAGTTPAPGNNNVPIATDYFGVSFPILDNVLYIPGGYNISGGGLYKYDASNAAGVTLVQGLSAGFEPVFIAPSEMEVVNNTLYFKITNYNGGLHDELWSSKGTSTATNIVHSFLTGESVYSLSNTAGKLYFVKSGDKMYGTELWRADGANSNVALVSDIFKGVTSGYPTFLTAFGNKLLFGAAQKQNGNELFITDGSDKGTSLIKDINTVSTSSSEAGYYTNTITAVGDEVFFRAYERIHGNELYKSNGTEGGTSLLNDIIPGETGSYGYNFLTKNDAAWFIAASSGNTYSIFKTNGKENKLQKITPDYEVYAPYVINDFKVADNGTVFYTLFNYSTYTNELWCSNGTPSTAIMLSTTLYYNNYLNVIGNVSFFVAGDATNGYELWKSNGTVAGTSMVKDINPGTAGSYPAGMFKYNNEVYFGANVGTDVFSLNLTEQRLVQFHSAI